MTAVLVLLSCVGLTFILKYGSILNSIRSFLVKTSFFKGLFSCSLCLGFWSGVLHSVFLHFLDWSYIYFLLPFVSSCVCWFADCLINLIQGIEILIDKKIENK